jgi:hypothetical protein
VKPDLPKEWAVNSALTDPIRAELTSHDTDHDDTRGRPVGRLTFSF